MRVSVVLSTYNAPDALERVLWGYGCQTHRDFEIAIADDGSTDETRHLIDSMRSASGLEIQHVWQEDAGFRKSRIINRATIRSTSDYLVFSDGDCIPRSDFLAAHVRCARVGHFLSGGYFKLGPEVSRIITRDDVEAGRPFDTRWLRAHGMRWNRRFLKLQASGAWAGALDRLTPTRATWNGHNASGWKEDILDVNGFDERMPYGGQDRELGERLVNKGVRPIQIRHKAICAHLYHTRGYVDAEAWARNVEIRRQTRANRVTWTSFGIEKGAPTLPEL